jgi:L-alanine-DL-glutamate epimerase-like enolase superfamily enzyme
MVNNPKFKILEASVFSRPIKTRMPFRFGRSTLTQMPIVHLRLTVETKDGKTVHGVSASGIPPLWFDKGAGKTHEDNIHDLSLSLRLALDQYLELDDAPVWFLHSIAEPAVRRMATAKGLNELTAGFGVALVDAALIDAACRHTNLTFHTALKSDLFGMGTELAQWIPTAPLNKIALRHTVGLSDPITALDVTEPIGDGLPETLEEVIREYRAGYFKIKISGDAAESRNRLRSIASVLDAQAGDYRATLDGNEQFPTMEEFAGFLADAARDPALQAFWKRILWIEQPVGRAHSLLDSVADPLREVNRFKPVIIDESDGSDETVDQAFALGYQGISAKNCKGVFRTLHSFRRIHELVAMGKPAPILSSEDLTHTPIVPLHQDLCVAAALGITHSERNGHHYIIGFDFLSPRERENALREFPSLYRSREVGNPVLRIEKGCLNLFELNQNGFGTASEPDWDFMEPVQLPEIPEDIIADTRRIP